MASGVRNDVSSHAALIGMTLGWALIQDGRLDTNTLMALQIDVFLSYVGFSDTGSGRVLLVIYQQALFED